MGKESSDMQLTISFASFQVQKMKSVQQIICRHLISHKINNDNSSFDGDK